MKKLRLLFCTVIMTANLSLVTSTLAQSAPSGCDPGETHGPPCSAVQLVTDTLTNPAETEPPEVVQTVVIVTIVDSVVGALLSVV